MINLHVIVGTEDMWVVEIDVAVFDGVARVDEYLSLSVELDGMGGFVDAIIG
jgi:hypothetical protein